MPSFRFNKLVRDKLPEMYGELNQKIVSRRLVGRELLIQLRAKLVEESAEIPIEDDDREAIIREISDAKQAIKDMQELLNITDEEVEAARLEKFDKKGGFLDGVFVELIELEDNDEWVEYYRKEPYKYPEQGVKSKSIPAGEYIHYKSDDKRYNVLGTGRNTETNGEYVIYTPLYETEDGPEFWVRPLDMFMGTVVVGDVVMPRFRRVDG